MKIDRVYPILGVDYRYNDHWKFNAVFPINLSIVYEFNPRWSVALASRIIDVRHRVNKHSHLREGLWAYRTGGIELAANYEYQSRLYFNVHIGSTVGGRFKIADRHNHHGRRFRVDPSGYVGAQCDFRF
jgi:hypothetical protein